MQALFGFFVMILSQGISDILLFVVRLVSERTPLRIVGGDPWFVPEGSVLIVCSSCVWGWRRGVLLLRLFFFLLFPFNDQSQFGVEAQAASIDFGEIAIKNQCAAVTQNGRLLPTCGRFILT